MSNEEERTGMGWLPDYPDFRDYTEGHEKVNKVMAPTGALLIRNSWGAGWGDAGYGWLPYEYVLKGIAEDFWSALKQEWVDTGQFKVKA